MRDKAKIKWGIVIVLSLFIFLYIHQLSYILRKFPVDFNGKINLVFQSPGWILSHLFQVHWNIHDVIAGLCAFFILPLAVFASESSKKTYRRGEEYGSARFASLNEIKPFLDPYRDRNMIFADNIGKTLNNKPKNFRFSRNNNVLLLGGSGTGKTRNIVKPNIMQMHSSYVITDPKGQLLPKLGNMLRKGCPKIKRLNGRYQYDSVTGLPIFEKKLNGKICREKYQIKIFNLDNFKDSMHYNPFAYVNDESDIMILVNALMMNTTGKGQQAKEDFWVQAERLFYYAIFGYIFSELRPEDQTMATVLKLVEMSKTVDDNDDVLNQCDYLFEAVAKKNPNAFCYHQYMLYKNAAGKTAKSILISCAARLAPFTMPAIQELVSKDELGLEKLGEEKTALFVITSDTDTTFNFLAALLYTQLFNVLTKNANQRHQGVLPVPVRFILDEFANIGKIPNFEILIATMRSRDMSCLIILQTLSQLKAIYDKQADTIVGNCDTTIFLGGKEESTLKSISQTLGKQTISNDEISSSKGKQGSKSIAYRSLSRELMTMDELAVMDNDKCIVQIRGIRPFYVNKYNLTMHPRYSQIADSNGSKRFDIKRYLMKFREIDSEMNVK